MSWAQYPDRFSQPQPETLSRGLGPTSHTDAWRQRAIERVPGPIGGVEWCERVAHVLTSDSMADKEHGLGRD